MTMDVKLSNHGTFLHDAEYKLNPSVSVNRPRDIRAHTCETSVYAIDEDHVGLYSVGVDKMDIAAFVHAKNSKCVDICLGYGDERVNLDLSVGIDRLEILPLQVCSDLQERYDGSICTNSRRTTHVIGLLLTAITTRKTLCVWSLVLCRQGDSQSFEVSELSEITDADDIEAQSKFPIEEMTTRLEDFDDSAANPILLVALSRAHDRHGSSEQFFLQMITLPMEMHTCALFRGCINPMAANMVLDFDKNFPQIRALEICSLQVTPLESLGLVVLVAGEVQVVRIPTFAKWSHEAIEPDIVSWYTIQSNDALYSHEAVCLFPLDTDDCGKENGPAAGPVLSFGVLCQPHKKRFSLATPSTKNVNGRRCSWMSPVASQESSSPIAPGSDRVELPPKWDDTQTMNAIARARRATASEAAKQVQPFDESMMMHSPVPTLKRNPPRESKPFDCLSPKTPSTDVLDMSGRFIPKASPAMSLESNLEGLHIITDQTFDDTHSFARQAQQNHQCSHTKLPQYVECGKSAAGDAGKIVIISIVKSTEQPSTFETNASIATLPNEMSPLNSIDICLFQKSSESGNTGIKNQSMSVDFMISPSFSNSRNTSNFMFSPSPAKQMTPKHAFQRSNGNSVSMLHVLATSASNSSLMSLTFEACGSNFASISSTTYEVHKMHSWQPHQPNSEYGICGVYISRPSQGLDHHVQVKAIFEAIPDVSKLRLISSEADSPERTLKAGPVSWSSLEICVDSGEACDKQPTLSDHPIAPVDNQQAILGVLLRMEEQFTHRFDKMERMIEENHSRLLRIERSMSQQ